MPTRNFAGPSGGRLARAKLETPTAAAIHASARRRRLRNALEKFPASRARFEAEAPGFAAPSRVVAPRLASGADDGETRNPRARRGDAGIVDYARGARRSVGARRSRRLSRPSRRVARIAFSLETRRFASSRRFDSVARERRAAYASRGRRPFRERTRGDSNVRGDWRRGKPRRTLASPRLRDAPIVDFGVAATRNERGFYGVANPSDLALKRDAAARRFDSAPTANRARGEFAASKREGTRGESDIRARRRLSTPRRARNDDWRRGRADAASSRFREGPARRFGRFSRGGEGRDVLGNAPRRARLVDASEFSAPRSASRGALPRSVRRRVSRADGERSTPRFGRVGAASFPSLRGARVGEGGRRGSAQVFPESAALGVGLSEFSAPSGGSAERFAFTPRVSPRAWTAFDADFGADSSAFDDAAFSRAAEPLRSPTSRTRESAEDWRLSFPGIDGVAERAAASRLRRSRTGEGRRLGTRDAAFEVASRAETSDGASWRVADSIGGRDGDARGLATIERLLKESRDALVALARDATGDLTLTTE